MEATELTFDDYAKLEPKLLEIMEEAKRHKHEARKPFCANAVWFGYGNLPSMKLYLLDLVGWERGDGDPVLSTQHAFDTCYDALYDALPDCDGCGCISL